MTLSPIGFPIALMAIDGVAGMCRRGRIKIMNAICVARKGYAARRGREISCKYLPGDPTIWVKAMDKE